MRSDLISIIMTAYNASKYIAQAIQSIVNQTYTNWELIITDDESTDNTVDIIKSFGDTRIQYHTVKHAGHSSAKRSAFPYCKGEYLTFFDSDDVAHPQWLELLYKASVDNDCDVAVCSFKRFESDVPEITHYDNVKSRVLDEYRMVPIFRDDVRQVLWNKIYKHRVFDRFEFPIVDPCSDVATCYKLVCAANKVAFIDVPLAFYRIHDTSMSAERKADFSISAPHRFALYVDMIDYVWEHLPKARFAYKYIIQRELKILKKHNVYDKVKKELLDKMLEKL